MSGLLQIVRPGNSGPAYLRRVENHLMVFVQLDDGEEVSLVSIPHDEREDDTPPPGAVGEFHQRLTQLMGYDAGGAEIDRQRAGTPLGRLQ